MKKHRKTTPARKPAPASSPALELPDQLLARYFRDGEIDAITRVTTAKDTLRVQLALPAGKRTDAWRDLGGGLGYVPAED